MNILVTDGENRSALAVTRSLGKRGCKIVVSGTAAGNLSASSMYCHKAFRVPDPLAQPGIYNASIADIVSNEQIDVVFPMTEQSIFCLNRQRGLFAGKAILACAPSGMMEAVSDKFRLFKLAEEIGVPIPRTTYVPGVEDFLRNRYRITQFPVVVKPALSKIFDGERMIAAGVMYAGCQDELSLLFETKPALRYPSMIQEVIVGEGTGLFTLFDHDRHLALFSHRRLLEKPPSGGVSVLSESAPVDEQMSDSARRLLSAVGWSGIAMVEFKRDNRDGRAKLMEINGRFWGSLQLAISSGMDFPALCLDFYLDKKPEIPMTGYSVGHRLRWFLGILDHLMIRTKKGRDKLYIPSGTPEYLQVVKELLNFGGSNTSADVYDSKDWRPAVFEAKAYIRDLLTIKSRK